MEHIIRDYFDIEILRKLYITKNHQNNIEIVIKRYLIEQKIVIFSRNILMIQIMIIYT